MLIRTFVLILLVLRLTSLDAAPKKKALLLFLEEELVEFERKTEDEFIEARQFVENAKQLYLSLTQVETDVLSAGFMRYFDECNDFWVEVVNQSHTHLLKSPSAPPEKVAEVMKTLEEASLTSDQRELFENLQDRWSSAVVHSVERWESLDKTFFHLLHEVTDYRGDLVGEITDGRQGVFLLLLERPGQLYYEIKSIPIRFVGSFRSRIQEVKERAATGVVGIIGFANDLFRLLLVVLLPVLALKFFDSFSQTLNNFRRDLWKKKDNRVSLLLSRGLQELNPYLGWFACWVIIASISQILQGVVFEDLRHFVPVLRYYVFYRVFRLLYTDVLYFLRSSFGDTSTDYSSQIKSSSKTIGLFFLCSASALYIVDNCAGHALLYRALSKVFNLVGIILVVNDSRWLSNLARSFLAQQPVEWMVKLRAFLEKKHADLLSIPILGLCIGIQCFRLVICEMEKYEFSKRILVRAYRRKIEAAQEAEEELSHAECDLPLAYESRYTWDISADREVLVDAHAEEFERIQSEIDAWVADLEDDHTISIIGEIGIGKTEMLNRIERRYQDLQVIRISIPPKVTTVKELSALLTTHLGLETNKSLTRALSSFGKKCERPTLILVDGAHNLFISKIGGFEAYRAFLEVINLQTENLFWIACFNEYAYSYLQGVMGFAQSFREEITLGPWSFETIKQLILKRHDQTAYRLSFRKIAPYAVHFGRADAIGEQMEDQFFGILWEQSSGNPRVAMHLWLTSLALRRNRVLEVGLPARALSGRMAELVDNVWFILAAILRHSNLTKGEAATVCSLPRPAVSNALKLCLDSGFVHKAAGGRYSLNFTAQSEIVTFLKTRNFVHG